MMKTLQIIILITLISCNIAAQEYNNPIIRGFNPDPSICRVGEDYYMVTSSFEYVPGIPVYHSRDLVNWKLIGHVLTRKSQIDFEGYKASEGVYAPTIRYHNGTFYVVVSIVRNPPPPKNIIMTAKSPEGPWSDPIVLTDSLLWHIDPSLFFDDDGKCYFVANRRHQVSQPYGCYREIAIQELDINAMKLTGPIHVIGNGALKDACTAEGPHIYKKDNKYYLLVSEGGTYISHAVTMSSSDNIFGPYQLYPSNPVLTNRHLQKTVDIRNIGHADIVQTQEGEWWMVCLGVRFRNELSYMGRETFLVLMIWEENSFPVASPAVGMVKEHHQLPSIAKNPNALNTTFHDDFNPGKLDLSWTFLRTPGDFYEITEKGMLKINLKPSTIFQLTSPSFIGRRIENHDFSASLKMQFSTKKKTEEAGMILISDNNNYILLTYNNQNLKLTEVKEGKENIIGEFEYLSKGDKYLKVRSKDHNLSFYFSTNNKDWTTLKEGVPGATINNRTFTGSFVGLYGSSNGEKSNNYFEADWFEYTNE